MELHVEQARRVVGTLQEAADAQEVERLVLQHRSHRDAARQVRAELDPLEPRRRIALQRAGSDQTLEFKPGLILRFPDFGGQGAAHRARVLARRAQAVADARRIGFVTHHVRHHVARIHLAVVGGEIVTQLTDAEQPLPAVQRCVGRLRQQRRLVVDVEHARGVLGPLHIARHPVKMVSSSRQHGRPPAGREHR